MMALDLREFGDWPLSWRITACMALALLALGLPWALLTRPILIERQALAETENTLQTRLKQAKEQVNALPPLPPETAEISPPLPNLPVLMTTIAEVAQASGLRHGQLRPHPVKTADTDEVDAGSRIELRLHGTWPQLGRFAADLAAPTWEATLGLRDIRLRASSSPDVLELSAIISVYERPVVHPVLVSAQHSHQVSGRNPFADTTTRIYRTNPQTVIGRIGNGRGQAGLVLGADGQLRRVKIAQPSHRE